MLTFKNYLLEASETPELTTFLDERCAPFLNELGVQTGEALKHSLYRGITASGHTNAKKIELLIEGKLKACLIKTVRDDRRPLDTPQLISSITDDAFEHIFGWRPRSQGMFCSGSHSQASEYGKVFQIFPIGPLKYLWSPTVPDMMGAIKRAAGNVSFPYRAPEKATADHQADFYEEISDYIGERYIAENIDLAISKNREIMIKCSAYLAVPT